VVKRDMELSEKRRRKKERKEKRKMMKKERKKKENENKDSPWSHKILPHSNKREKCFKKHNKICLPIYPPLTTHMHILI
jgi:hypothetical protein